MSSDPIYDEPDFSDDPGTEDLTAAQILLDKAERVLLGFLYLLLLGLAISNVWQYLYKQKMYKSVPMLCTYILLVIFAGIQVGYEFYMGIACGEHDCMERLLLDVNIDDKHHYITNHKS